MASEIDYYYFHIRGRGELVRLILHAAGEDFTDHRVSFADFQANKANTPFGTLPYIKIDGQIFGESLPISRFLARKYNLMGQTELEELQTDIILNRVFELRETYLLHKKSGGMLTEEQKNELGNKYSTEQLPKFCDSIDKCLTDCNSGYLVGNKLTIADLAVMDVFDLVTRDNPDYYLTTKYPKVNTHRQIIRETPNIARYLADRPRTSL